MRALLTAVIPLTALLLAGCAPARSHYRVLYGEPMTVLVRSEVLDFLDRVHAEFENEVAICLTGQARGDTIHVTGIDPVHTLFADARMTSWRGCTDSSRLGIHHNHPTGTCAFSTQDAATMEERGDAVWLVSCGGGRFAWRLRTAQGVIGPKPGA